MTKLFTTAERQPRKDLHTAILAEAICAHLDAERVIEAARIALDAEPTGPATPAMECLMDEAIVDSSAAEHDITHMEILLPRDDETVRALLDRMADMYELFCSVPPLACDVPDWEAEMDRSKAELFALIV